MQFNDFCASEARRDDSRKTERLQESKLIAIPSMPRTRERQRRGCDSISECEHCGFLIAAKELDEFPLYLSSAVIVLSRTLELPSRGL